MEELGISRDNLFSNDLPTIAEKYCTCELIINLHDSAKLLFPDDSLNTLCRWLGQLFSFPYQTINQNGIKAKLNRLKKLLSAKRGDHKKKALNERFSIPTNTVTTLPSKFESSVSQVLASELVQEKEKLKTITRKSEDQKEKQSCMVEEKKILKRKIARSTDQAQYKDQTIKKMKMEIHSLEKTIKSQKRKLENQERRLKNMKHNMKRSRQTLSNKWKTCQDELKDAKYQLNYLSTKCEQFVDLVEECTTENKEAISEKKSDEILMKSLKSENEYLKLLIEDVSVLETFDDRKNSFNEDIVECVMNVTDCNVAANKVADVIAHVCKLCNKKPTKLPSEWTVNRINLMKGSVAQRQLEDLSTKENLTLYTDETSKFGKSFEVYTVTDKDQNSYLLGLREMANKASHTVLDTLKDIISDIDGSSIQTNAGQKILSNIKNTMSDRATTEKKFHELLEDYRLTVLPDVLANWESLSLDERKACSNMNNFFCGLHLLVGCADICATAISKYENLKASEETSSETSQDNASTSTEEPVKKRNESGTLRLTRCCSKALARGADEKSGVYGDWKLHTESIDSKPLFQPFRHNRFNIVFMLGGVVYFHRQRIQNFLENVHGVTNLLLEQICVDIKVDMYVSGCRAFGLISKQITSPLWRIIESQSHIFEMNKCYLDLTSFLVSMKDPEVATAFLYGQNTPFGTAVEDPVHEELTKASNLDNLTIEVLQVLCENMHTLLQRQVADQLPGGKYAHFSEELKMETFSSMKHNKLPEFFFGQLDFLMSYRPNASLLCNESFLMFSHNKSGTWLKSLPDDEKKKMIDMARKQSKEMKSKFNERLAQIQIQRKEALRKKEEAIAQKRERKLKGKEDLTNLISYYGLWQSDTEVTLKLQEIRTKTEKKKAIQAQLNFRKKVLLQKSSQQGLFAFSGRDDKGKSRQFPVEKLEQNLRQLINEAFTRPEQVERNVPDQPLLVGKTISHKFSDGQTYKGRVISTVPGYPSWYNLKYEEDDVLYVYDLLLDYAAGDLTIIL